MPAEQSDSSGDLLSLSGNEEVLRHQLNIRAYWVAKEAPSPELLTNDEPAGCTGVSAMWCMTRGIALHDWQRDCIDQWFQAGGCGVVKVVTGAGKTVFAMALIERLQNEREPNLRVVVVVPTVVLMEQWQSSLLKTSNLPESAIGCLGGGNQSSLDGEIRVLIAVLNSASSKLPQMARKLDTPLLLIVDECHRAGAYQMSKIFDTPRAYSLGLSATPERDVAGEEDGDDDNAAAIPEPTTFDKTLLGRELGAIIYELDYRSAIERGILARFILKHYGLPLAPGERQRYDRLSREISELRKSLQAQVKGRPMDGGALVGWARRVASRGSSALAAQASQYVRSTSQRKLLLYHARARITAVSRLVQAAVHDGSRVILFHESIDEVMKLFAELHRNGHTVVVEHSKLPDSIRQESIRLFRDGNAQVLVSARSLIEGFDVPAADIGIVVASSASVRQRVQTLGRILRKKPGQEDRTAILHVLYMADTTDEMIYEKENWEEFTGAERNQYFVWDPETEDSQPLAKNAPPRRPKPRESQVDMGSLSPGDDYPGAYEGDQFSADSQGNIRNSDGGLVSNPQGVPTIVAGMRGSFGRFRVTPEHRAILVPAGEGRLLFGGILADPFQLRSTANSPPASGPHPIEMEVRTKADGPRIMLRISGGEIYARRTDTATDPVRGRDAEKLATALTDLQREKAVQIRKITLTPTLDVFAEIAGQREIVTRLQAGLEFKDRLLP